MLLQCSHQCDVEWHGTQVCVEAGSQLVAFFKGDGDVVIALAMVRALVHAVLGSESAALVEAARGSVVVYITLRVAGAKIDKLVDDLLQNGAEVSFTSDGASGFIKAVVKGVPHLATVLSGH